MKSSPSAAAVLLGVMSAGCTVAVDSHSEIVREEKRFTVNGVADLRLTTFDGSIRIEAWDKPDILIEIEKRGPSTATLKDLEVVTDRNGDRIELEVKRPRSESYKGLTFHRTPSASLVAWVPRDTNITGRSGDGSIRIERVNGRIELRTADGSITASHVSGELRLDTSDGAIRVADARGRLQVETGDGSVDVGGKLTSVRLHTGDGSIVYRAEQGSAMSDNWDITTGDGSVSVYLPQDFAAELDAHTGDGSIRTDLAGLDSSTRANSRRSLRARIGNGGRVLRIRTGDGAIRLRTT